jgi:hypothetical protein
MESIIDQEAITKYVLRKHLMKVSASLSGILRTCRSQKFCHYAGFELLSIIECTASADQPPAYVALTPTVKNRNSVNIK